MTESADVVVIGAGVTGLVVAHALRRRGLGVRVFESSERPGGVIQSDRVEGYLLEHGPFSVMARSPEFWEMIDELELEAVETDADAGKRRYIQRGGRLHLVPTSPKAILGASLLSPLGKARMIRGVFQSKARPGDVDETIAQVATRRMGREVAERMAGPATVGIFAAEADELSFDACFPMFAVPDREAGSVGGMLKVLKRQRLAAGEERPIRKMVNFAGGLAEMIDALAGSLGDSLRLGRAVTGLEGEGGGFRVEAGDETLHAEQVVITTVADAAAYLLGTIAPEAARELKQIHRVGLGVVHLGFDREAVGHPLDGFGYLIQRGEPGTEPLLGVLWPGSVFPGHAPEGKVLLRAMVGGTRWPGAMDLPDDELISRSLAGLRDVLKVRGEPSFAHVVRWPRSIPLYAPGHPSRAVRIRGAIDAVPGLFASGNWAGGLGVNDRILEARRLAPVIAGRAKKKEAIS